MSPACLREKEIEKRNQRARDREKETEKKNERARDREKETAKKRHKEASEEDDTLHINRLYLQVAFNDDIFIC